MAATAITPRHASSVYSGKKRYHIIAVIDGVVDVGAVLTGLGKLAPIIKPIALVGHWVTTLL